MKNRKPLYEVPYIRDIRDTLRQTVERFGDRPGFLLKKDGKIVEKTYRAYEHEVNAIGTALIARGFADKRIAVIGENRYEWGLSYMAVVCGVGIVVPLDKELPEAELFDLMKTAELDAVFYSPKCEKTIQNADIPAKFNMETDIPVLIAEGEKLLAAGDTGYTGREIDPDAMQILLFTSGTTSTAKAVMLSHANIAKNMMGMCAMSYTDENDVFLSVLPLHHTYECTCGFICEIYRGSPIAYCEGLRYITKNLAEYKVTCMLAVPLLVEGMYHKIWKQAKKSGKDKKLRAGIKLSRALLKLGIDKRRQIFSEIHESFGGHLRMLVVGAAALDPEVVEGFRDFGILAMQGYGLTECAPIAALNRDCCSKDDAVGLPLPGVDIRIDDPDENGIGEVVIRGGNVMLGYYKNPEATAAALRDGWFYSGDYGFIDEDGFLHLAGRKKNVIVTKNGKNIFPEEIETFLNRVPIISDCMVYGVDKKDGDTEITAQILPDKEEAKALLGKDHTKEQLQKAIEDAVLEINHSLQGYKRVAKVIVREEDFVRTTTKKIKRHIEIAKEQNK